MKLNVMLTVASLLSILFSTFHLTDDIIRGWLSGTVTNLTVCARLCHLAVRNAGARRAAIGVRHHAPRFALFVGHPRPPHDGEGCDARQPGRQLQRSLFLHLDAHRGRRDRALLRHPLGARTLEPAKGPAPVVQQPEHGKARSNPARGAIKIPVSVLYFTGDPNFTLELAAHRWLAAGCAIHSLSGQPPASESVISDCLPLSATDCHCLERPGRGTGVGQANTAACGHF